MVEAAGLNLQTGVDQARVFPNEAWTLYAVEFPFRFVKGRGGRPEFTN